MAKRKTTKRLEALIDALEDSKPCCVHNRIETDLIVDKIITYQCEYKRITGRYYSMRKNLNE